jgi:hypothetical protein
MFCLNQVLNDHSVVGNIDEIMPLSVKKTSSMLVKLVFSSCSTNSLVLLLENL